MAESYIPPDLNPVEQKLMETVLRGVSGALVAGFSVVRLVRFSKVAKAVGPARKVENP